MRVLIVDDHETFRSRARLLLEGEGYEVVGEAGDAAGALAAARALLPDVVVLDVQLPDRSGIEIAAELLEHAGSVVLISSRQASDYGERIAASGARGFVWKGDLSGAAIGAILGGTR